MVMRNVLIVLFAVSLFATSYTQRAKIENNKWFENKSNEKVTVPTFCQLLLAVFC